MGNYASSCTTYKSPKSARVIFPGGEIRQFRQPIDAAELMLDFPNFFLVNFRSIKLAHRFQPLRADQSLEPANMYVFFPMKRVRSLVTAADVAITFMSSSSTKRVAATKVTPEIECGGPRLSLEGVDQGLFKHRSGIFMCRSKKPMLDTIRE